MSVLAERGTSLFAPRRALTIGAVLAVALWVIGILVVEGFGDTPDEGSGQALVRYFSEDEMSIYVGSFIFAIGSLVFLWWAALLRTELASRTGEPSWLPTAFFGSAIAVTIASISFLSPQLGGAFAANDSDVPLEPGAAQALWYAGDGLFIMTAYAAASMLIAVGLMARSYGLLPMWVIALLAVAVLLQIIPGINWLGVIFGLPIAVLLIGFFLKPSPATGADPVAR